MSPELEKKLKQLSKWRAEHEVAKDMYDSVKKEVIALMEKEGLTNVSDDEVIVKISSYESSRFDSKRFKEEAPKIYEQYVKKSTTNKVSITLK